MILYGSTQDTGVVPLSFDIVHLVSGASFVFHYINLNSIFLALHQLFLHVTLSFTVFLCSHRRKLTLFHSFPSCFRVVMVVVVAAVVVVVVVVVVGSAEVGSADVGDWQMAGALQRPPASPGCG